MKHRIAQKAPKNASVPKKVPKKHGKGKPSTVKLSRILQHLQNNAGHSGSDQSDSEPKMVTGKSRRGQQISRLLQTPHNNAGHSGSDQSDSAQSDSAQLHYAQLYSVPKMVTGKNRWGKQMSRLLQTPQNNAGHSGSD